MARKGIADYIVARGLSTTAQSHLKALVERYPYFHAVRLLYLRSLFQNHDPSFDAELRKAALYVPSRTVLYNIIEGERLNPAQLSASQKATQQTPKPDEDRTNSLIGQFLDSLPKEKPTTQHKADATVDYIAFLQQTEADSSSLGSTTVAGKEQSGTMSVIDSFLDNQEKLVIHDRKDEELLKPQADEESNASGTILTEVMAKIYIKQKKYDQALEIIQTLSLKNPKKSRYFADQIRFLEKLITNSKN